jgi:YVTN family beta-propeller protein
MARQSLPLIAALLVASCAPGDRLPRGSASGAAHLGTAIGTVASQDYRVLARLRVGGAPGQIAFTKDGRTAYVTSADPGRVLRVDVLRLKVTGSWSVPGTPMGVFLTPDQDRLAVSRYGSSGVLVYRPSDGALVDSLGTPPGPSLFAGPYADDTWYVAGQRGDGVVDIDGRKLRARFTLATGRRPFPPAATMDGLELFVPEYDDGTVSIFDLEKGGRVGRVAVGRHPSGGAVLSDGTTYAVAVAGEGRVVFVSGVFYRVEGDVRVGIGGGPASVVPSRNGRVAYVNNTLSDDVSVLSLKDRLVATRVPVGKAPVAMAVAPDGSELWVSCARSKEVWILEVPVRLR